MGRGKRGFLDELSKLPWPVGLIVGVVGFLCIWKGIPMWLSSRSGILAQAFHHQSGLLLPLAFVFLAACALASLVSCLEARRKRQLFDTLTGLESMASLGWREFEQMVGEAFRRQGYRVEETGLGGADGGIDLILSRDGKRVLVQCKQWRRERVPVNVVREMYGLLAHHRADEVQIVAMNGFTTDADRFAQGKPITLLSGNALLQRIRANGLAHSPNNDHRRAAPAVQDSLDAPPNAPACPRCAVPMVRRTNRRTGQAFWGCGRYPACHETRPT